MLTAVRGDHQLEMTLNRIAECDAVLSVPKRQRIVEAVGIGILELQRPRFAAVCRLVDPRISPGPALSR